MRASGALRADFRSCLMVNVAPEKEKSLPVFLTGRLFILLSNNKKFIFSAWFVAYRKEGLISRKEEEQTDGNH